MTTNRNKTSPVVGTSRGKPVTNADIERMTAEAEAGYDVATLRPRGGRPPMGSGLAEVVPVRLDPELRAAAEARAIADETTTSEVIREALRRSLASRDASAMARVDVEADLNSEDETGRMGERAVFIDQIEAIA